MWDLSILSCVLKKFSSAQALFNNFWTLSIVSRLSPECGWCFCPNDDSDECTNPHNGDEIIFDGFDDEVNC